VTVVDGAAGVGIDCLGLERARPVIVLCGGAGAMTSTGGAVAQRVVGPAVVAAAIAYDATIVDGGTDSGVMRAVGQARTRCDVEQPLLVGVAPLERVGPSDGEGKTALEPNHTHHVLLENGRAWGDETTLLFDVAAELANSVAPVVVVLAGGGKVAMGEVDEAIQRGWPLLVVEGSGGLADAIVAAASVDAGTDDFESPVQAVGHYRRISVLRTPPNDGTPATSGERARDLQRRIGWMLGDRPVLRAANETLAVHNQGAKRMQTILRRTQQAILGFGVAVTFAAIADTKGWWLDGSHWFTIVGPILIASLGGLAAQRAVAKRWVLLRAAAETVLSETFRYRTGTGPYSAVDTREAILAERLALVGSHLVTTEVGSSAGKRLPRTRRSSRWARSLARRRADPDDRLPRIVGDLDEQAYLAERLRHQLTYQVGRAAGRGWWRNLLQTLSLVIIAGGSLLAVADQEVFVALSTAMATGIASYLTLFQHDHHVVSGNPDEDRTGGGRASLERITEP
jgi:hypothetical protein